MRSTRNAAVRWKKWPLLALCIFLISIVIMLTASLNDLEKSQRQENKEVEENDKQLSNIVEQNPYMTTETKIIIPKDKDETDPLNIGNRNKPDFPKPIGGKTNELPEGYIIWKEPNSKLSDPKGPGQGGKPVPISADESSTIQKSYKEYGFNQYVSDKISLHRSVPDIRPISCHFKGYQSKLPKVSVIIIFHNEGWSTLFRTVHSVLDRSPPELLHEIILCDDFSVKEHLKEKLEKYVASQPKVKLIRTVAREGLIRARMVGADFSTGEVLLFLDSHCEANAGWLPPLLSEIAMDYRTVVCPIIDFIDHRTFLYRAGHTWTRGTFSWRFDYKERSITADQYLHRKDEADPVPSPVMAGGLFAISRKFWEELGKYDPDMYVWGGEQYELSFKLWMCGGRMFNVPCSRVGHVYRDKVPYKSNKLNAALVNFKRVAEVWMDGFKNFLYHYREDIGVQDHGDISKRVELRNRLKCKSFEWYLANVANDTLRTRYEPNRAAGKIKSLGSNYCMYFNNRVKDTQWPIVVSDCSGDEDEKEFKIFWTYILELRYGLTELCAEGDSQNPSHLYVEHCHETGENQAFIFNEGTKQIVHKESNRCLQSPSSDSVDKKITLMRCDSNDRFQKWGMNLQDVEGPAPDWAKVADEFYKKYKDKKL